MNLNMKLIVLKLNLYSDSKINYLYLVCIQRTEGLSSRLVSVCPPDPDMVRIMSYLWRLSCAKCRVYYSFIFSELQKFGV